MLTAGAIEGEIRRVDAAAGFMGRAEVLADQIFREAELMRLAGMDFEADEITECGHALVRSMCSVQASHLGGEQ